MDTFWTALEVNPAFYGLYDQDKKVFVKVNEAFSKEINGGDLSVEVVDTSGGDGGDSSLVYGKCNGIPVVLTSVYKKDALLITHIVLLHTNSDAHKIGAMVSNGMWEWYPSVGFEYMSDRFWDMFGYSRKSKDERPGSWVEMVDEGDMGRAMAVFGEHIKDRNPKVFSVEMKYKHEDGHMMKIKCSGCVTHWLPDGQPWRVVGTTTEM